jgi:hypothetical protein
LWEENRIEQVRVGLTISSEREEDFNLTSVEPHSIALGARFDDDVRP